MQLWQDRRMLSVFSADTIGASLVTCNRGSKLSQNNNLSIGTKNIGWYHSSLLIPTKTIEGSGYCISLLCVLDYMRTLDYIDLPAAIWRVTDSHDVRRNSGNTSSLLLLHWSLQHAEALSIQCCELWDKRENIASFLKRFVWLSPTHFLTLQLLTEWELQVAHSCRSSEIRLTINAVQWNAAYIWHTA